MAAGRQPRAAVLLLLLLATWCAAAAAQVVPLSAPKNSNASTCHSITQCYVAQLGMPTTPGEWMTAYMSALHEHCAGLLQLGGPNDCSSCVRCVYLQPNGTVVRTSRSSSGSVTADHPDATAAFLAGSNSSIKASTPGDSQDANATAAAHWRRVAASLQLQQPACLPNPTSIAGLRYRACPWLRSEKSQAPILPVQQLSELCKHDLQSCFMHSAANASAVQAWWTGAAPRAMLNANSSWRDAQRLQEVAFQCAGSWQAQDRRVTDACATRGIGATPWNNSLRLNRLVVALVDAFESSACNNTVTFSEAMAVQQILRDLCVDGGCSQKATSAALAAARCGSVHALAAVLALLAAGALGV